MARKLRKQGGSEKRVVFLSDLHCGSEVAIRTTPTNATQTALLDRWHEVIDLFGAEPDMLVLNGDANDGQDRKGMSIRDDDVPWQIAEAEALIRMWRPRAVRVIEGSAYHTGDTVQLERFLAGYLARDGIDCQFTTKLRLRVNGWFKFQARHKVGRSCVPYGQHTSPSRYQTHQVINAAIEAEQSGQPVTWPHLSVFGHVHYWSYAETAKGAVVTLPCWKAVGDRFGDTQCEGHIDLGAFQVRVGATQEEGWTWARRLYSARIESRTEDL